MTPFYVGAFFGGAFLSLSLFRWRLLTLAPFKIVPFLQAPKKIGAFWHPNPIGRGWNEPQIAWLWVGQGHKAMGKKAHAIYNAENKKNEIRENISLLIRIWVIFFFVWKWPFNAVKTSMPSNSGFLLSCYFHLIE